MGQAKRKWVRRASAFWEAGGPISVGGRAILAKFRKPHKVLANLKPALLAIAAAEEKSTPHRKRRPVRRTR